MINCLSDCSTKRGILDACRLHSQSMKWTFFRPDPAIKWIFFSGVGVNLFALAWGTSGLIQHAISASDIAAEAAAWRRLADGHEKTKCERFPWGREGQE